LVHRENILSDFSTDRELNVQYIDNAIVMPVTQSPAKEGFILRGGAYKQNGLFMPLSGRTRRQNLVSVGPYPKSEIVDTTLETSHKEPAVFCGYLDNAFGHFLLESTAKLWWGLTNAFTGNYVFQIRKNQPIPRFVSDFFELLGISDRIIYVNQPTLFEHLVIPEAAFIIRSHFHPDFLIPFRMIRENIYKDPPRNGVKKVYLTRTKLSHRRVIGEDTVEKMFSNAGFKIVSPEKLSLIEQIKLIVEAEEIAGIVGSALHTLVFAQKKKVIYLSPDWVINSNYSIIDQAIGIDSLRIFAVGQIKRPAFKSFRDQLFLLDLETVQTELVKNGYLPAGNVTLPTPEALENLFWATRNCQDKVG